MVNISKESIDKIYTLCYNAIYKILEVMKVAKTDTINIRIEPKLKKEVETTLNDLGMNIADAVTVFFKQIVMTESIPFAIKKPKYNKETIEAINEAKNMKKNPEKYKSYNNVEELMEDLNSEED